MNLDFNNIRPLGSLNEGFEELVCQLAHRMDVPGGKRFVRNGRPDGGVECYWEFDNGNLWVWQAKFFVSVPGASQFEQISDSVKTALRLHENIKKFFIAVPQDLPDDGKDKTKSAKKRYDEKVEQWHKIEGAENVEFIYWGKHELLDMLSRKENEGLIYFWFNKDEFTEKDFEQQNKIAIDSLGARYTPELNVELDIAKLFDGLSRNARFADRVKSNLIKFKKSWQRIHPVENDRKTDAYKCLEKQIIELFNEVENISFNGIGLLPFESCKNRIQSVSEAALMFVNYLEGKQKEQNKLKDDNVKKTAYSFLIRDVKDFYYEANGFAFYLDETECKAANMPIVLLDGEAGVGKSHLLADVVLDRKDDGRYSLLFLGQNFNAHEDPWTQIFKQLKFRGSDEEFLQALEAKAESTGNRIILFIDALNEGGGKELWNKYIVSFVNQVKDHPWLGLVLSIRTTYIKSVFGEQKLGDMLRITHRGFENRSFDAIKLFFKNSNISLPSVPLLLPEFKNPLFLKLFCDGLHKNGLTKIDEGMQGITSVIDLFIDGVEKDLSAPNKKDYLLELHIVRKAVNSLIDYQVNHLTTEVPLEKAIELTDSVKTDKFSNGELLYELVSCGVLTRNMRYGTDYQYEEVVYLSYERFNDFLTAQRLLEQSESTEAAIKQLIKDKNDLWYYAGILESFAIIIPEKEGKELYEFLSEYRNYDIVVDSVIKSLLWRKKSTIGKALVDYFNEVLDYQSSLNFLSVLIQVGPTIDHYFNAEFLHRNLMQWSMTERDSRWSIGLKRISGDNESSVDTLITWAKEYYGQAKIDSESKYLTAIVLAWFTTCMDRGIRDNASKGLIALVRDDVDLMIRLIEKFEGVKDPYVAERIYAAAYGCALLSKSTNKLPELAKSVYAHIFDVEGEVYPDAMVRDYAKGVIEYTLTIYPDLQLGDKTFVPPYNSSFPEEFPDDEEVRSYSKKDKDGKWITPGIDAILSSMVTEHGYTIYGDFGRYVFQSNLYGWHLDPQKLSNLAVKWIMERYGYKEDLFGTYDSMVGTGRMRNVSLGERVGKKYQWIALHEMMARVSDNYPLYDSWYDDRIISYNGTWEPCIRDFDPTMLVQKRIPHWFEPEEKYWWNDLKYAEWNSEMAEWASNDDNLPDPANIIETVDDNGIQWLALQAMPDWVEPHGKDGRAYRNLWYQIRSYIIDEDKFADFALWALDQKFTGRWMPESSDRYELFSREFYWSPAYRHYEAEGLTDREILDRKSNKKIADVELPCINFLWESEYDYSKQDTLSYLKPSKQLFEGMGMKYSDTDGELLDTDGNLICFDACANHNSHGYFLVRKDALIQYLQSNHKRILWVLIGEKNILGSSIPYSQWLEISGSYYLDPKDEVKGTMTTYLEGKPLRKPKTNKQKIDILENYQSLKSENVYFDNDQRQYSVLDIQNMLSEYKTLVVENSLSDDKWNTEKRSKYIESLLAGIPLTTITLTREFDGKLKVLDGGQRISAIKDYVDGKFSLRNMNMMDLYEDCTYKELPSSAKSRLIYSTIPFNVITTPIDEKTKAEIYNRLNTGIHQISEKNRRLLQYKGRMTEVMNMLVKDRHFTALTKDSRKADKESTKEDIVLRLIADYVITQGNNSFSRYINESYNQQLLDVAKFINETVADDYIGEMKMRLKAVLKDMDEFLGNDITKRINETFSLPLMEIVFMAFLFKRKIIKQEMLKDIVYKYIDDNTYKISHSGNDSSVKFRERLMLALDLNKKMNV